MNILLAEAEEIVDGRLILTDRRADHIVKVLRAAVGDAVRVGVINGSKGSGVIEAIQPRHPRSIRLRISLQETPQIVPPIDLILALARPIMMRRILSQATALGVGRFYCIHANRVEKSFWEASLLEQGGYGEHLQQGLEQAVDTRMPEVYFYRRFKPFIEDFLPTIAGKYDRKIIAHPGGNQTLGQVMKGVNGRVLLAIGPEGGWVEYEIEKFQEAGFVNCSLGERILKVDTAVVALHARISQLLEAEAR